MKNKIRLNLLVIALLIGCSGGPARPNIDDNIPYDGKDIDFGSNGSIKAADDDAEIFTVGQANSKNASEAVFLDKDTNLNCPGVKDLSINDSFLELYSEQFTATILKSEATDPLDPSVSDPTNKKQTICIVKGKVKLPTNHILDIDVDADDRAILTQAKLDSSAQAYLELGISYSTTSSFTHSIREGFGENVLETTDRNTMRCKDAKKNETEVPFEIKALISITQGFDQTELSLKIGEALRLHFRIFDCLPEQ